MVRIDNIVTRRPNNNATLMQWRILSAKKERWRTPYHLAAFRIKEQVSAPVTIYRLDGESTFVSGGGMRGEQPCMCSPPAFERALKNTSGRGG